MYLVKSKVFSNCPFFNTEFQEFYCQTLLGFKQTNKESFVTSDLSTIISLLYLTLYHKLANVYVRKTNKIVNTGGNKISMSIREIKNQQRNKQRPPQQILQLHFLYLDHKDAQSHRGLGRPGTVSLPNEQQLLTACISLHACSVVRHVLLSVFTLGLSPALASEMWCTCISILRNQTMCGSYSCSSQKGWFAFHGSRCAGPG